MSEISVVFDNNPVQIVVEENPIDLGIVMGKQGKKGDTGKSIAPKGEWSALASYNALDLVSYQGSSYVAIQDVPAGTLPTDTDYWQVSASASVCAWGSITGTLTDQTDLQSALDAKADIITRSVSADLVHIEDGAPRKVSALSVGIEPVQDLHGYDNPWPAGGGKNLVNNTATTTTSNDVTFTVNTDGSVTCSGTATGTAVLKIFQTFSVNADLILSGCPSGGNYNSGYSLLAVKEDGTTIQSGGVDIGSGANIHAEYVPSIGQIQIVVRTGTNMNGKVFYPMIRLATVTDASYAPYANICPITGHTQAVVTRTGANFLDLTSISWNSGILDDNGNPSASGASHYTDTFFAVAPNTQYTISGGILYSGTSDRLYFYDSGKNWISRTNQIGTAPYTFTTPEKCYFIRVQCSVNITTPTDWQLELGSTATTYESYQGQSVTIALGSTVYGGTLDVLAGTLTVTHGIKQMLSSFAWTRPADNPNGSVFASNDVMADYTNYQSAISNIFAVGTGTQASSPNNTFWFTESGGHVRFVYGIGHDGTSIDEWKDFLDNNPTYICAKLRTPLTVTLTPAQLTTLLGVNNVWADTGETSLTYNADTKLYIDEQIAESARKTREMMTTVTDQMKAPKNLTSGDLIIVNDDLYKATANISNGSALTVGSNVIKITLAEYIKSLL